MSLGIRDLETSQENLTIRLILSSLECRSEIEIAVEIKFNSDIAFGLRIKKCPQKNDGEFLLMTWPRVERGPSANTRRSSVYWADAHRVLPSLSPHIRASAE